MKSVGLFMSLLLLPILYSCNKEVDLLDDYEPHTIVYGLIDHKDDISYIRIEKSYLTAANIYDAAQIPDSNQFSCKLEVVLKSEPVNILFDTMTLSHKDTGIFYGPNMLVYYAHTGGLLNTEEEYQLEITHPKTGKITKASLKLHDSSRLKAKHPLLYVNFEEEDRIVYESIENIKAYQLLLRFHYMKQSREDTTQCSYHYIDWPFPFAYTQNNYAGEEITYTLDGWVFYELIHKNITPDTNAVFYYGYVDFIMSTADLNFYYYIESVAPSASLVMDKQAFTNIENGSGVLASKSSGIATHRLSNRTKTHLKNLKEYNFVGGY